MEQDPTRICELLVGLGDVDVVGVDDEATEPLVVHIQTRTRSRPVCGCCGGLVRSKDIRFGGAGGFAGVRAAGAPGVAQASLVLPGHGLCDRFVHRNQRRDRTDVRSALTTRVGRWATTAVGRDARAVSPMWLQRVGL